MATAFLDEIAFRFTVGGRVVVFFRLLLAFVRRLHGSFAVGARKTGIVRLVIALLFFVRLFIVRTG